MCNEVIQASFDLFFVHLGQSVLIYIIAVISSKNLANSHDKCGDPTRF